MNAEIISVGSELLLGQIANTDAQYIAQKLAELGINMYYQTVIGDNKERLLNALVTASARSDLIITTGGLGPTMDDLTKETVSNYLGLDLELDQTSWDFIKNYFKKLNRPLTENNKKQALMPKDAIILPNHFGTAPGAIIEKSGKIFVVLPGPPNELQPMFNSYVIPYLSKNSEYKIYSKVLRIFGIGESLVEERIKDILVNQSNPTIAPLASQGQVTLRITVRCRQDQNPLELVEPVERKINERLGDAIYGSNDDTLQSVVARLLQQKQKKLAIAESCTGGLIGSKLIDVPGISGNFLEGFITYTNDAKIKRLGVSRATLKQYGAVSKQTAKEMAEGVLKVSDADVGISVTGIAGPGGGSKEKPVGLVYIGVSDHDKTEVHEYKFSGHRNKIRNSAANTAIDLLRRALLSM